MGKYYKWNRVNKTKTPNRSRRHHFSSSFDCERKEIW